LNWGLEVFLYEEPPIPNPHNNQLLGGVGLRRERGTPLTLLAKGRRWGPRQQPQRLPWVAKGRRWGPFVGWVSWEGDTSPAHVRRVLWARGNLPLPIPEPRSIPG